MFYKIQDDRVIYFSDYRVSTDDLEYPNLSMMEYEKNKNKYIISNGELVENPDYESLKKKERETLFKAEFFNTSLGWIRRKVTMKDGSIKDFLGDLLLSIKAGLELGQTVEIITYKEPDYTKEYSSEYIISLQERKNATSEFIQECLMQTVKDFGG